MTSEQGPTSTDIIQIAEEGNTIEELLYSETYPYPPPR